MKNLTKYGIALIIFGIIIVAFPVILAAIVAALLVSTGIFLIRAEKEIRDLNNDYVDVFDNVDDILRYVHVRRW